MHPLLSFISLLLPLITTILLPLTTASSPPIANRTSTIYHHTPSSTPVPLAILTYNPALPFSAELTHYTPPKASAPDTVTSIGLKNGPSTAVSTSSFTASYSKLLRVVLDAKGEVVGAAFHAGKGDGGSGSLRVEVVGARNPPLPMLERKVVAKEGEPVEGGEKTFFQKYWWLFLAATALAVLGGGGDK